MYLGVEALGILGDSVELWETQHVLLAARPIEYPQSERRQCSKDLRHTQDTHTAIKYIMTGQRVYIYTYTSTSWTISVHINSGIRRNSTMF